MMLRRSKEESKRAQAWRSFRSEATPHLDATGAPPSLLETQGRFTYFLLHGFDEESGFSVPNHSSLSAPQRTALLALCDFYLSAGNVDPGIALLGAQDLTELNTKYPNA